MAHTYRFCEVCRCQIDPERVETCPDSQLCETHAKEIVRYGGEFISVGEHENAGRAGSIKGVTTGVGRITRRRNEEALHRLIADFEQAEWEREKRRKAAQQPEQPGQG